MATKKDLDTLLGDEDTPKKPVIRRGQGLRLSTESQAEPSPAAPAEPRASHSTPAAASESQNRTHAKVRNRADIPVRHKRVNRGYKLREDLIKACKRIALEEDRKLYEVMEEALAQYLAQKEQKG